MKLKFIDSATFIAIFASYFYCIDTVYTNGYLSVFGLDNDLLERNFHQVIYSGFMRAYHGIFLGVGSLFLVFSVLALCKLNINFDFNPWRKAVFWFSAMIFMFGLIYVLSHYESNGIDDAKKWKKEIAKGHSSVVTIDKYKNELAYLYCGSKNCAGYDIKEQKIIYFPQTILAIRNKNITIKAIERKGKTASLDPTTN
ncbi:hypothetical protein [Photobacterium damselae]|uniref:Uncharacterized protein n=2 Tax=Photobacterium damselae TaxID=38293 RepID=D0Z3C4_PHODD|nr:hypothetical protein [Photobacterium damselae]EEZ39905.1 hypothetical protein VDA_000925 [Photobacterium damselae subsp. damselae CIP 102761]PSW85812.1 hypothetical protein CTN07_07905 [Photobacterium damselae]SPY44034.1 Uncharacterised protein [Photobacterium damselae]